MMNLIRGHSEPFAEIDSVSFRNLISAACFPTNASVSLVHFLQNIRPSVTLELERGFKIRIKLFSWSRSSCLFSQSGDWKEDNSLTKPVLFQASPSLGEGKGQGWVID